MGIMAKTPRTPRADPNDLVLLKLVEQVRAEVRRRYGNDLTYEQRRDASAEVMGDALWVEEAKELQELATDDDEVEIDGVRYRRLGQHSSAEYRGRWGAHTVVEPLYRKVGVHNGPTVKPLEQRVGMISRHMTPDLARIVAELSADGNSREVEKVLGVVGLSSPSRAFLEKRVTQLARKMDSEIECLEQHTRASEPVPSEVASVSCGMDRMAIRMVEPSGDPEAAQRPRRKRPYQRTPPPPKEYQWRMAWVGNTPVYDAQGGPLHTWRYAVEADSGADELVHRVSADVKWIVQHYPSIPVQCVQDGASELDVLPERLARILPMATTLNEVTDFEHLMGYLDDVVDACQPEGDPKDCKGQYRAELLSDDGAIDSIWCRLRRLKIRLLKTASDRLKVVDAALSYIGKRRDKMRFATFYDQGLTIGSGATEGTVGLMQQRVKRRGQSWDTPGLRGVLSIRCLVLSNRWDAAWQSFAADHRKEVRAVA